VPPFAERVAAFSCAIVLASSIAFPALAALPENRVVARHNGSHLDELFTKLLTEKNPALNQLIESRIWRIWLEADNESTQGDLTRGIKAMNAGDALTALDAFNAVVVASPEFSEGWNKRATLYYLMGNHAASVADIERTLALEPRHFGALSGLALIYEAAGRWLKALEALNQVRRIHPRMSGLEERIDHISKRLGQAV
jgi:tetratricopeptide (TPR) repeat protein